MWRMVTLEVNKYNNSFCKDVRLSTVALRKRYYICTVGSVAQAYHNEGGDLSRSLTLMTGVPLPCHCVSFLKNKTGTFLWNLIEENVFRMLSFVGI